MFSLSILAISTVISIPITYLITKENSIKKNIEIMIRELKLYNSLGEEVLISYEVVDENLKLTFDISGIINSKKIEENKRYIKELFKAEEIIINNDLGSIEILIYPYKIKEKSYEKININATNLLLGYNRTELIIADMKIMPHLLVSGLSGQGKTGLLRTVIANLGTSADIYLCNAFEDDFMGFKNLTFIKGIKEILFFLKEFKKNNFYYQEKPRYIILEELMTLTDKKVQDLIKEFLCVARHYNVYIIGVIQVSRAEDFKAKTFFNSRVTFKQEDKSSYGVAIGTTKDLEQLSRREFYFKGQDGIVKGRTFTLDF